jgi:hypothetical protein
VILCATVSERAEDACTSQLGHRTELSNASHLWIGPSRDIPLAEC